MIYFLVVRIERRTETAESETDRFSEDQNYNSTSKPVKTKLVPPQPRLGIGEIYISIINTEGWEMFSLIASITCLLNSLWN